MGDRMQTVSAWILWISTFAELVLLTIQGWSGNWITFFLILPGATGLSDQFLLAMGNLAAYHVIMGYILGVLSIIVLVFAFVHKSSVYVRIFAVLGLIIVALAAVGGILFVNSGFHDRFALGQMADSLVGALAVYFLQFFFMNKTPRFWFMGKHEQY